MSLKEKAVNGFVWTGLQHFGSAGLRFVTQIILSRIITPDEFGLIGMILIFNSIGIAIAESGISQSVTRMEKVGDDDYSTLFVINLIVSICVYIVLFIGANYIGSFYGNDTLVKLIRVYSLIIPIYSLQTVQSTKLLKDLNFKRLSKIQLESLTLSSFVGILLGYLNCGVWALVWMQLTQTIYTTINFWVKTDYFPRITIKKEKIKTHFDFGYKLLISGVIDSIFTNVYPSVIAKYNPLSQVGFYTRAHSLQQLPVGIISSAFNKVTFPIFSTIQNDPPRLVTSYRRILKIILFIVSPLMFYLVLISRPLIIILFSEKWLPMQHFFEWLCMLGIVYPLHVYYLNSIKVMGRSDLFLKSEMFKKSIILALLIVTAPLGIIYIIYGQVVGTVVGLFINQFFCSKVIPYKFRDQNIDIFRIIIPASVVFILFQTLQAYISTNLSNLGVILSLGCLFFTCYLFFQYLFNKHTFFELLMLIKKITN